MISQKIFVSHFLQVWITHHFLLFFLLLHNSLEHFLNFIFLYCNIVFFLERLPLSSCKEQYRRTQTLSFHWHLISSSCYTNASKDRPSCSSSCSTWMLIRAALSRANWCTLPLPYFWVAHVSIVKAEHVDCNKILCVCYTEWMRRWSTTPPIL